MRHFCRRLRSFICWRWPIGLRAAITCECSFRRFDAQQARIYNDADSLFVCASLGNTLPRQARARSRHLYTSIIRLFDAFSIRGQPAGRLRLWL